MTTVEITAETIAAALAETPKPVPLSPEHAAELRAQLAASPTGRVSINVDPNTVHISDNVRSQAAPTITVEYVQSILDGEDGFEQDPTAFINSRNEIQIIDGQRRTLAARAGNYNPCPVLLRREPKGSDDARRASVIVSQVNANDGRVDLTAADRFAAQEELAGLNIPKADKAKQLRKIGVGRKQATALRKISAAPSATRDAIADGELDLWQGAVAADLDVSEDERRRLVRAAAQGLFDNTVIAIQGERREAAARAVAAKPYSDRGFTILEREPYRDDRQCARFEHLALAEGGRVREEHITDPKYWAVYLDASEQAVLIETGEEVDEKNIDPATYTDPAAKPAEGMLHANAVRFETQFKPVYGCLDFKKAGLQYVGWSTDRSSKAEKTATRNTSRRANELARNDTAARRKFLSETFYKKYKAKKLPHGVLASVGHLLLTHPDILSSFAASHVAAELFGLKWSSELNKVLEFNPDAEDILTQQASDERVTAALALQAMAAIEAAMQPSDKEPKYWRAAEKTGRIETGGKPFAARWHLRVLCALGYTPGPIDRVILGSLSLTEAFAEADRLSAEPAEDAEDAEDAAAEQVETGDAA
ncbi:hypothetical protein ACWELJ_25840 [Nocardia sp. NPDC004582]